ncbi:hypothetical protein E4N62_31385 [Streptomyces sp. MNU76]|uniref:hypothetical protein n=1 Tax=Streptomyces sp. MNU76 TaxID=2560026 RepID=UPI001E62A6EF|nr:hypothetical protein [Streptomyces sp. MNU76]MCC9709360.1 hypothetical protein [Streptomyces sp. MNU76]
MRTPRSTAAGPPLDAHHRSNGAHRKARREQPDHHRIAPARLRGSSPAAPLTAAYATERPREHGRLGGKA